MHVFFGGKPDRFRRILSRRPAQLAGVFIATAGYTLAYLPLRVLIGSAAGLLAIVPVVLSGWFFGLKGGLVAGLATPLLNTLLLNLGGQPGWDVIFRETNGLGPVVALAVGAIIGHWSDLAQALQRQLADRQQTEAALANSEQQYHKLFDHMAEGYAYCQMIYENGRASDWVYVTVNHAFESLTGLRGVAGKRVSQVIPGIRESDPALFDVYARVALTGQAEKLELFVEALQQWFSISVYGPAPGYFVAIFDVITERKQTEQSLRESEARYRSLFEESAISLWEEDFSAVKQRLDALRRQGITDFSAYFEANPMAVAECAALVKITDVNQASLQLFGARSKAELLHNLNRILLDESYIHFRRELIAIALGNTDFEGEITNQTLAGERILVHVRLSVIHGYEDNLSKVIVSLTDITERRRAEDQLQYTATHDALTGLPNRAFFLNRLHQALERSCRRQDFAFAVLFLDLDRFKVINDSLGHLVGDQVLVACAQRLIGCVRALDTVTRLGGDEFIILLEDVAGYDAVTHVADRIQQTLQEPFELDSNSIVISASIGIVLSSAGSDRPEDILRDADSAMYRAKALGKARHEVFQAEMRSEALTRLKLESDLRRAVERDEFRIHYQPIVSLVTGQTIGFEALVRWQHPEFGLLPPAAFLAIAEESSLIIPIGHWLLRTACRQLAAWQMLFPRDPPLTVSINMSSQEIAHPELDRLIKVLLDENQLAPNSLRLELTERTIIDDTQAMTNVLDRLKALGVRLEIDDFGSGYSALSYLQRLEIDALKIDRSFIQQIGSGANRGAVIRTILALGQSLHLQIIAEGVETDAQLDLLKTLGCPVAQGYLFGKPMEAAEVETLLAS